MSIDRLKRVPIEAAETELDVLKAELELKRIELENDIKNLKRPSISGLWIPVLAASIAAGISAWSALEVARKQEEIASAENTLSERLGELEIKLGEARLEHEKSEAEQRRAEVASRQADERAVRKGRERQALLEFEADITAAERPLIVEALSIENEDVRRSRLCVLSGSGMFSSNPAVAFFEEFTSSFDCKTMQEVLPDGQIVASADEAVPSEEITGTVEWCRDERSVIEAVRQVTGKSGLGGIGRTPLRGSIELTPGADTVFLSDRPRISVERRSGVIVIDDPADNVIKVPSANGVGFRTDFAALGRQSPFVPEVFSMIVRLTAFQYPSQCATHAETFASEIP